MIIHRIIRGPIKLATLLADAALILMVLIIASDILMRVVWNQPILGAGEIAQFIAMVAIAFLALPAAYERDENISAPLILDMLSSRLRAEFKNIGDVCSIIALGLIGYFGLLEAVRQMGFGEAGISSGIPIWWIRFAIPVAACLVVAQVVSTLVDRNFSSSKQASAQQEPAHTDSGELSGSSVL